MGFPDLEDERFFSRYLAVSKAFNGKLFVRDDPLDAVVSDVSRDGLGVLSAVLLAKGEQVTLELAGKRLAFSVAYCQGDLIHPEKYRCGLQRIASTENLVNVFRANGFLLES